jgi:glycosyltransferase involved in cell wall biosynthesis
LEEALDSILGQSYSDFELIISDNASTDRTRDICAAYMAKDHRIRYMRNETNLGAAENYNRVFRASRGRYFKWAAHDDVCAPEFLERCLEVMERDDSVALCYPASVFVDENGKHVRDYIEDVDYTDSRPHKRLRTWLFERPGGWCNLVFGLIRSNVLDQTGLIGKFDSSDYILIGELALWGKIHRIPEVMFYRRDHSGRSTLDRLGIEEMTKWFDSTAKSGAVYLPRWRWLFEYWRASARVRLSAPERAQAIRVLCRWAIRIRHGLARELVDAGKIHVGRLRSSPEPAEFNEAKREEK